MSAQTAEPADSFKVDYFSGANSEAPDGTVRISNVGTYTGESNTLAPGIRAWATHIRAGAL
jgi:hypothetical protein